MRLFRRARGPLPITVVVRTTSGKGITTQTVTADRRAGSLTIDIPIKFGIGDAEL